jgi:hypothetical protein
MAIPKAKPAEPKKPKTLWSKLKNSAIFILIMVIIITAGIVYGIIWISRLLSGQ